jgi:hypothetical protein
MVGRIQQEKESTQGRIRNITIRHCSPQNSIILAVQAMKSTGKERRPDMMGGT